MKSSRAPARVLAIDFGKVRAGIAISDELGLYAHARPALDATNRKSILAALTQIIRDEGVERLLIGLPLELSGDHGPAARRALQFAQELADATGIEVELIDERLSTVEAGRQLRASGVSGRKQKAMVDGVAASVLLQSWLDGRRRDLDG
ncbi:MAG TPA: Holliday junction resolvase RuvX [Polyangiaceae bacterium]|nr:Holliday junction resolvase RuvX [Polyangiaceae bacterium]